MPINGRHSNPEALRRHHGHNRRHHGALSHSAEMLYAPAPIQLRSTGYQRQSDGSVTLSVTLDKDQVECCVCLSAMTGKIYRCRGNGPSQSQSDGSGKKTVCHNICAQCQWQMRRMKSGNGHTKEMQCPICKVKGAFVRNRALERQLTELSQQCVNGKHGCSMRFFPWDDRQKLHEKHLCAYHPVDCPFCYQSIPGGRVNFVEHLAKSSRPQSAHSRTHRHRGHRSQQRVPSQSQRAMLSSNASPEYLNLDSPQMVDDEDHDIDIDDDDQSMLSQGDGPSDAVQPLSSSDRESASGSGDDAASASDQQPEHGQIIDIESGPEEDREQIMLLEDEEEEKEPIQHQLDDDEKMAADSASGQKAEAVPPCLMEWHRSKETLDLTQSERNVIGSQSNEFVVNYNLGIVSCFVAPTDDCPCWKVFALSIAPRHGLGGNSRVYVQYLDDDVMNQFVAKEQSMGLVTQCLSRPVTNTLVLTLGRLHPTSMRKRFGSYPERNPFLSSAAKEEEEENLAAAKRKRMFSPRPECEMKDDGEMNEEEEDVATDSNLNHNHRRRMQSQLQSQSREHGDTKMDTDDPDTVDLPESDGDDKVNDGNDVDDDDDSTTGSDLDEYEPAEFFGQSPCSQIQCGFIYGGNGQFGQKEVDNLCVRVFTLEESFKVGAVIDARDFTGKWYQAEVIAVQDAEGAEHQNLDCDADDYLDIRRAKIHYLGYSQNYDEWLNVDTDSHRIAQRGTFTIGPDLRAIRRNTTNLQHGHHPDQPRSAAATFSINRGGNMGRRERANERSNRYSNAVLNAANNDQLDQ